MRGFITFGEDDYDKGFRQGKKSKTKCMFHVTPRMEDIERFVAEPAHEGSITGHVQCDALGGELPVIQGWFNLFVDDDEDGEERKLMKYRLWLEDGEGHPITLNGFKEAKDDPGFDIWSDTTTLFTHILAGHVPPGPANEVGDAGEEIVATGILHVLPADFAVQMTTFRVDPAHRVDALGRFGSLFLGSLWDTWKPGGEGRLTTAAAHTDEVFPFRRRGRDPVQRHARQGAEGADEGPRAARPRRRRADGDLAPADAGADARRGARRRRLRRLDGDLAGEHGRARTTPGRSTRAAVLDHPLAVRQVLDRTGADSLQASRTARARRASSWPPARGFCPEVRTIVSSAVSLHPVVPRISKFKLRYVVPVVSRLTGYLDPQWGIGNPPWILPKAVTAYCKVSRRKCDNGVCKVSSFMFGAGDPTLWTHEQLSPTTHEWTKGEFGPAPLTFFKQISKCVQARPPDQRRGPPGAA